MLREDRIRNRDLADVVQQRAAAQVADRVRRQPQPDAEGDGHVRDPAAVAHRLVVAQVERPCPPFDRAVVRVLEFARRDPEPVPQDLCVVHVHVDLVLQGGSGLRGRPAPGVGRRLAGAVAHPEGDDPLAHQRIAEHPPEHRRVDRVLDEEVLGTQGHGPDPKLLVPVARQDDDRHVRPGREQALGGVEPAAVGQV
jgi:hypothetical protein